MLIPVNLGRLGPYISASKIPTLCLDFNKAKAKLIAVVDLPTPPFPLATAIMYFAGFNKVLFCLIFSLFFLHYEQ